MLMRALDTCMCLWPVAKVQQASWSTVSVLAATCCRVVPHLQPVLQPKRGHSCPLPMPAQYVIARYAEWTGSKTYSDLVRGCDGQRALSHKHAPAAC